MSGPRQNQASLDQNLIFILLIFICLRFILCVVGQSKSLKTEESHDQIYLCTSQMSTVVFFTLQIQIRSG